MEINPWSFLKATLLQALRSCAEGLALDESLLLGVHAHASRSHTSGGATWRYCAANESVHCLLPGSGVYHTSMPESTAKMMNWKKHDLSPFQPSIHSWPSTHKNMFIVGDATFQIFQMYFYQQKTLGRGRSWKNWWLSVGSPGSNPPFLDAEKLWKAVWAGCSQRDHGFPKVPEDGWTNAANQMITHLHFKCLLRCWGAISQTRGVYYIITGFAAWHMFQVYLPWSKRGGGWSNHNHEGARILTSYTTAVPVKREWWKMEVPLTKFFFSNS